MGKTTDQKQNAIIAYFDQTYSSASSLTAWQAFSRDVGVTEGNSITQCKKILKSVNVNIADFVAARKNDQAVFHFPSRGALANYIRGSPSKRFPLKRAKADSFLKVLLVHLY